MGMTKAQTSLFLAIFFATIILCAVVICTCFYCYKPSIFLGGRRSKSPTDSSDSYTGSSDSGSSSEDVEKAPRGRVVGLTTETAARHPSDHSDYEAEEIEVVEAEPESEHSHHHHHHHHGHGEHIDIIDANPH
ncbi:uncharacterized protein LAJ45_08153 [Morchella importuna]|uniref:Uncharacterized protein n=1 Tax=Morchella conica CCBAS932 TaxID=1392247 RepID=A0A3N4KIR6_9PEZI|nr:uncharacterized protein LAJ45_08153 [Morchella importuna]KAH8147689.1 hypothetical protein LAJ45_08153 [Morchella importuna]RPB10456.1 hypothetical protein P167DRAFT_576341 [Morchella conica CCBAS932]